MSAAMSFKDWISLLDLFNTPYPNNPFGGPDEFYAKLAEAIDEHNEGKFIFLARQWILYHAGINDADQGQKIWSYVDQYLDRWYKNKTGPDVYARFRHAIYGDCKAGGKAWYNYQPCPVHINRNYIHTLDAFENQMHRYEDRGKQWQQAFAMARIKFMDLQKKVNDRFFMYTVQATAERLNVEPTLLVAGLRGEF